MSLTPVGTGRQPAAPWSSAFDPTALGAARALDEGRLVLEDFVPLEDSLEWRLGQEYYRHRGNLAFVGDTQPIPFAINNDGSQSIRAAEVFFTSLVTAEESGPLPQDIFVLELGIGVGLFARYFLDWFEALCRREGTDYYDRLTYIAADRSARMLRDAGRAGVFANHPGRYRLRLADALCPEQGIMVDADVQAQGPRPLRAVFLNYLLDCLPASVVRLEGDELQRLHVRTSLPKYADWHGLLDATDEEVKQMARAPGAGWRELLPLYPAMQADYQYRPTQPEQICYGDFALHQVRLNPGIAVLHSHGALCCLEALLALLADGGVILANDYGQVKEVTADEFEHQRFSHSSAVGLNFALLGRYFSEGERACWREPGGDEENIHARLLMRAVNPPVAVRFVECYGEQGRKWLEGSAQRARELANTGRFQAALGQYREALARHPFSWPLLIEVAQFLAFVLGDPASGLDMAREAIRHNPACCAEVWNVLGDCLYLVGRKTESRQAFEKALLIATDDVRARFNLAFVHADAKEYELALVRLAEGLARDRMGAYRDRLLHKQAEVLGLVAQQNQRRLLGQVDRVAGISPLPVSGGQPQAAGTRSVGSADVMR